MQCPYCKEEVLDDAIKCKHCKSTISAQTTLLPIANGRGDFGELLSTAGNLWKSNLGDLVVLSLVYMLVVWVPFANVGFAAGYVRSVLKVIRGEGKAEVGDLFKAWDCFLNLLVYLFVIVIAGLIMQLVPLIGQIATIVLYFLTLPGLYAIIDLNLKPVDAFKWSLESIQENLANWLLTYVVCNVITIAGFALLFVGVILTAPLAALIALQQYERVKPA